MRGHQHQRETTRRRYRAPRHDLVATPAKQLYKFRGDERERGLQGEAATGTGWIKRGELGKGQTGKGAQAGEKRARREEFSEKALQ